MTEFTSSELASLRYTVPSRSEVDDYIESVERIYHASVTVLQMGFHEKVQEMIENRDYWVKETRGRNHVSTKNARQLVDAAIQQRIIEFRIALDSHIQALQRLRDWQKNASMVFLGS